MFRLSKLLEKLEDKSEARFKSWLARNKAKLPMRIPAVIVGWYFLWDVSQFPAAWNRFDVSSNGRRN